MIRAVVLSAVVLLGVALATACSSSGSDSAETAPEPVESPAQATSSPGSEDSGSFGDGTFTVGENIAAGKYEAAVSKKCTLTIKETGGVLDIGDGTISGNTDMSVTNSADGSVYTINSGSPVFNLKSGWVVTSEGCGTWTASK